MKRFRRLLWLLGVCAVLAMIGWVFRAPLLVGLAKVWIVDDPLTRADAIVVLGGGLDTRPFEAARLYHQGLAPKILVLNVQKHNTDELGVTAPETELTRQVLLKKGVPPDAILVIGDGVASTRDECVVVLRWVEGNKPKRLIIPTELFHTRRVSWSFRKALKATGTEVRTCSIIPREYTVSTWWQREKGLITFQNEVIKFGYYVFKY